MCFFMAKPAKCYQVFNTILLMFTFAAKLGTWNDVVDVNCLCPAHLAKYGFGCG
jgi:hypothetical protein